MKPLYNSLYNPFTKGDKVLVNDLDMVLTISDYDVDINGRAVYYFKEISSALYKGDFYIPRNQLLYRRPRLNEIKTGR